MENTLKVLSWIEIVLGGLALIGWLDSGDTYSFFGGVLFIACGWVALTVLAKRK